MFCILIGTADKKKMKEIVPDVLKLLAQEKR
jgi:hypothetical protein